jgi:hypothetical protein
MRLSPKLIRGNMHGSAIRPVRSSSASELSVSVEKNRLHSARLRSQRCGSEFRKSSNRDAGESGKNRGQIVAHWEFLRHDAKLLTEHGKVGFVNSSMFPVVTIFCTTAYLT